MKVYTTLILFAAISVAQNEFPDPDYEPNPNLVPVEQTTDDVRPFVTELFNVRNGVITLDKAIIAFDGPEDVAPTLQAASELLDTINAEAADALTHPQISQDINTPEGINATAPVLDYASSLIYHINHTAVNLVLKEGLAVKYCQGPAVLAAIEDQAAAAQTLIDNFIPKLPTDLQSLAPVYVSPIFDALSSASSVYADQTTTSEGCTPPVDTSTSTTTSVGTSSTSTTSNAESTPTATGTGNAGSGNDEWEDWEEVSCDASASYASPTRSGSSQPTGWSTYGGQDEGSGPGGKNSTAYTTPALGTFTTSSSRKPTSTGPLKTYTGAGVAHQVCIDTVILTALAAFLL